MPSSRPANARTQGLPRIVETEEGLQSLRQHLTDVIEGAAFKGSHRCGQFLKYIVERAIAGHADSLKERLIGVELFGRPPSYDTGEDAIVRVTASDVRHRLLQHYGIHKSDSNFRITLPQGTYVPEITHASAPVVGETNERHAGYPKAPAPENFTPSQAPSVEEHAASVAHLPVLAEARVSGSRIWLGVGLTLTIINILLAAGMLWIRWPAAPGATHLTIPWSEFFSSSRLTHLIASDPNLATVQDLCGGSISVSDYANHKYIRDGSSLPPETLRSCQSILSGHNVSDVDPGIAARIAALAQRGSAAIDVRAARNTELTDLKTDDNYILLGSPRSNPWSALFIDELDFRFVYDQSSKQEIIQNVRPRPHELSRYVPTAMGGGTGQSFAIIAVVQNIDQNGLVMLLAGADAEGTEAAGNFATDPTRLSTALRNCEGSRSGGPPHFEVLLQVDTMAGSPNRISMAACHVLLR